MQVPHCLDYNSLEVSFEIRDYESYNLVLHFQDCFGYSTLAPTILTPRDRASSTLPLPRCSLCSLPYWSPFFSNLTLQCSFPHFSTLAVWAFSNIPKSFLPEGLCTDIPLAKNAFLPLLLPASPLFPRLTPCHSGLCSNVILSERPLLTLSKVATHQTLPLYCIMLYYIINSHIYIIVFIYLFSVSPNRVETSGKQRPCLISHWIPTHRNIIDYTTWRVIDI